MLRNVVRTALLPTLAAAVLVAPAAQAADTGAANVGITVGVRSITLSSTSLTCAPALTFPNGQCDTEAVTVTAGSAGGHVLVQGGTAFPSSGSANWTLCDPFSTCTGPTSGAGSYPGVDQFTAYASSPQNSIVLATTAKPDSNFGVSGAATPGQSVSEKVIVSGPSASTSPATSFSTSVIWTNAP